VYMYNFLTIKIDRKKAHPLIFDDDDDVTRVLKIFKSRPLSYIYTTLYSLFYLGFENTDLCSKDLT